MELRLSTTRLSRARRADRHRQNGDGTQMLYRYEDYYDATDGDNLTLTLDSAIQSYCESILKRASSSSRCRTAASASPWTPIRAKFWPGPTPPPTI